MILKFKFKQFVSRHKEITAVQLSNNNKNFYTKLSHKIASNPVVVVNDVKKKNKMEQFLLHNFKIYKREVYF